MKIKLAICPVIVFLLLPFLSFADTSYITITAKNNLSIGRQNQTILLSKQQLKPLDRFSLRSIHVKNAAGRELLCQAIDTDGNHSADAIIFQADFAPHQTKKFTVYVGNRNLYRSDQYKAFGRFVRERFDDFAWENDRIAQRTYGKALAMNSSTIDVWAKKTNKLVINPTCPCLILSPCFSTT